MGHTYLIFAMFAENAGKILDKYNYSHNKIEPRESLAFGFSTMAIVIATFSAISRPEIPPATLVAVLPLVAIITLSFANNILDEQSLKINKLSLREPLSNFRPILAGSIGYVLFPDERNTILLLALIAGALIVAWGVKPKELSGLQRKGVTYMLLTIITGAIITNVYALALDNSAPEFIALIRTASLSVLFWVFFRPKRRKFTRKRQALTFSIGAGIVYGGGAILSLYALQTLGVVTTALLTLLGPALRYLSAYLFLSDVPTRQQIMSSALLGLIAAGVAFV